MTWHTWNGTHGRLTLTSGKTVTNYKVEKADFGFLIRYFDESKEYQVKKISAGWKCDCESWKYSKDNKECKHVQAIREIPGKMSKFQKAVKKQLKLRLALCGPTGSGKTYTALTLATNLGKRVAVIDTEHGSASKYADLFNFDVLELTSFSPLNYAEAIRDAEAEGYDVVVIDSLSHAWVGKDGALEQVDNVAKRSKTGNKFNAWGEVTPMQNEMIETMLSCKLHLVVTMRSKMDYVQEKDERTGKNTIRKVGLAPVQRDGMEYEFDVVGDMDTENNLVISKSRCPELNGKVVRKPGKAVAVELSKWLDGTQEVEQPAKQEPAKPQPKNNSVLPANGNELRKRLTEYDYKLAKQELCEQGDLVKYVVSEGVKQGYSQDISEWQGAGMLLAAELTKEFESQCRQLAAKRKQGAA